MGQEKDREVHKCEHPYTQTHTHYIGEFTALVYEAGSGKASNGHLHSIDAENQVPV